MLALYNVFAVGWRSKLLPLTALARSCIASCAGLSPRPAPQPRQAAQPGHTRRLYGLPREVPVQTVGSNTQPA